MLYLPNVLVTTNRSPYMANTGITGQATNAIQQGIAAHIRPVQGSMYKMLPVAALESEYVMMVESGTDIRESDVLIQVTLMDGITPWPEFGLANNRNETYRVSYIVESTPGPLQHRTIYIKRERGGGPTY